MIEKLYEKQKIPFNILEKRRSLINEKNHLGREIASHDPKIEMKRFIKILPLLFFSGVFTGIALILSIQ